jgi:hypothetical protein
MRFNRFADDTTDAINAVGQAAAQGIATTAIASESPQAYLTAVAAGQPPIQTVTVQPPVVPAAIGAAIGAVAYPKNRLVGGLLGAVAGWFIGPMLMPRNVVAVGPVSGWSTEWTDTTNYWEYP